MEKAPHPPVNEVILSVAFDKRDDLVGPQLPAILGPWYEDHPLVQVAAEYEMPIERPQSSPSRPQMFRLVEQAPQPRYLLRSRDEREVVQVQDDYLAIGWRRRDPNDAYVGYSALRAKFAPMLERVAQNIDGGLQPKRAEINYTNIIEPNSVWSHADEVHKLFRVPEPPGDDYEQLAVQYSRAIMHGGAFAGRLHVTLQPAVELLKQEPRLSLMIIARSADLEEPSIDAAVRFLDSAHEGAYDAFRGLLTNDAQRLWGFE